jgi:hypothetical protein
LTRPAGRPILGDVTKARRPRDPAQLGKLIVDLATGEAQEAEAKPRVPKRSKGGRKGGRARAKALPPEQREEIARLAAQARWKKS